MYGKITEFGLDEDELKYYMLRRSSVTQKTKITHLLVADNFVNVHIVEKR